jgi:hypothetical protein
MTFSVGANAMITIFTQFQQKMAIKKETYCRDTEILKPSSGSVAQWRCQNNRTKDRRFKSCHGETFLAENMKMLLRKIDLRT